MLRLGLLLLLVACAGPAFIAGTTTQREVWQRHGPAAMEWQEADGTLLQAFPSGPAGTSTVMARFDARLRLLSYEEVLDTAHFARIQPGMSMDEVQRIIGPPWQPWTSYFKARDELVWEWRYCDAWAEAARFNVLFDGTTKRVRSTLSLTESQHFGSPRRACGRFSLSIGAR